MIGSKVLLYTVLHEVEEVVPMVGEEVEGVEEVGRKVARQVVLKVEEVVEEVVRKVGVVAPRISACWSSMGWSSAKRWSSIRWSSTKRWSSARWSSRWRSSGWRGWWRRKHGWSSSWG